MYIIMTKISSVSSQNQLLMLKNAPEFIRRSNFCKDHRDKIEVPDPLVVEDLISDNLNNTRK